MVLLSHEYKQKNKAKTVVKHKKHDENKTEIYNDSCFYIWSAMNLYWFLTLSNALQNMLFKIQYLYQEKYGIASRWSIWNQCRFHPAKKSISLSNIPHS